VETTASLPGSLSIAARTVIQADGRRAYANARQPLLRSRKRPWAWPASPDLSGVWSLLVFGWASRRTQFDNRSPVDGTAGVSAAGTSRDPRSTARPRRRPAMGWSSRDDAPVPGRVEARETPAGRFAGVWSDTRES
jgi:hypothetical protein